MSIFVSPKDYIMSASDCSQVAYTICGRQYKMWCKKDKASEVDNIVQKILPTIEELANQSQVLQFDKVLLMALIEYLIKNNDDKSTTESLISIDEKNNEYKDNNDIFEQQMKQKNTEIKQLENQLEKANRIKEKTIEDLERLKAKLEECYEKLSTNQQEQ